MKQIEIITKDSRARVRGRAQAGRAIQEMGQLKTADQIIWQTGKSHSGAYTCCLWVNGNIKAAVKFNVVR